MPSPRPRIRLVSFWPFRPCRCRPGAPARRRVPSSLPAHVPLPSLRRSDDVPVTSGDGASKFWWQETPAAPAPGASVAAPTSDVPPKTTATQRVAANIAAENKGPSVERALKELERLAEDNPDLRDALASIQRGPDGAVTVGSLRRAEATLRERYAAAASVTERAKFNIAKERAENPLGERGRPRGRSREGAHEAAAKAPASPSSRPLSASRGGSRRASKSKSTPSPSPAKRDAKRASARDTAREFDPAPAPAPASDPAPPSPEYSGGAYGKTTDPSMAGSIVPGARRSRSPARAKSPMRIEDRPPWDSSPAKAPPRNRSRSTSRSRSPGRGARAASRSRSPGGGSSRARSESPARARARVLASEGEDREPLRGILRNGAPPEGAEGAEGADGSATLMPPRPDVDDFDDASFIADVFGGESPPGSPVVAPPPGVSDEETDALAAKTAAAAVGRDVDPPSLVASRDGIAPFVAKDAVLRAVTRPVEVETAPEDDPDETRATARRAATARMAREYRRAHAEDKEAAAAAAAAAATSDASSARAARGPSKLDAWTSEVARERREAELRALRTESAEAARRALAEEWDRYVAEGAEPADAFLRELARRREAEAEETAKLREEIEETRERLREARENEAARGEMLEELHEKAEAVARAEAEADATEARAKQLRESLPPMAAVVRPGPGPEAVASPGRSAWTSAFVDDDASDASAAAPDLEDLASAIARDLDESVRRVRRAMGDEPEPAHAPATATAPAPGGYEWPFVPGLTLPSHPYTLVAPPVAPPVAPSDGNANAPAASASASTAPSNAGMTPAQEAQFRQQMMVNLQLQQQQHYLREQITLRERREAAAAAARDAYAGMPPRFTYPSYAPMQERDLGGAPETPTRDGLRDGLLKPVPSHWQSPAREARDDGERTRGEDAKTEAAEPATATNDAAPPKPAPVPIAAPPPPPPPVRPYHPQTPLVPSMPPMPSMPAAVPAPSWRRAPSNRAAAPPASAPAPPRRVTFADREGERLTGHTPREYVSDLVERAYRESLAQQRAVFGA